MGKCYTFRVACSFVSQHTFTHAQVERDPEGGRGDVVPTDEAIVALQREWEQYLSDMYVIDEIEVDVSSDSLLGTQECTRDSSNVPLADRQSGGAVADARRGTIRTVMTHRDYFIGYQMSVQEYGEILVASAFSGTKPRPGKKGFDVEASVDGVSARIEVKTKLATTKSGKATVVHCNDNKFQEECMTHLALVLVDGDTGHVTEAWLVTKDQAERLRTHTNSKYIKVNDVRTLGARQHIASQLNMAANREISRAPGS